MRLPPNWMGCLSRPRNGSRARLPVVTASAVPPCETARIRSIVPERRGSTQMARSTWVRGTTLIGSASPTKGATSSNIYGSASLIGACLAISANDGIHHCYSGDRHVGAARPREHTRRSMGTHARHHARCSAAGCRRDSSGRRPISNRIASHEQTVVEAGGRGGRLQPAFCVVTLRLRCPRPLESDLMPAWLSPSSA